MLRKTRMFALLVALALLAGACQPLLTPVPSAAPEQPFVSALEEARTGKYAGTTVTMEGPWPPGWEPYGISAWPPEILGPFEEQTGIKIDYKWWEDELNVELQTALEQGTGPDIVEFTNPYPMVHLARLGKAIDMTTILPMDYLRTRYEGPWLEYGMLPGPDGELFLGGLYTQIFVNSVVYYPLPAFEDAGYTVPETWDELTALIEQMVADGNTPWCLQNGEFAQGFPATVPLSDIMMRTVSPDEYQNWLTGKLKFDSPQVRHALDIYADTWLQPGYFYGTRPELATYEEADLTPIFQATPPGCYLMAEPVYLPLFGGLEGEYGEAYGFFNLPPIDPAYGQPVQVEGHFLTVYQDRPEVRALVEYLVTGEPYKTWRANYEGTPLDTLFSPHPERDGGIHQTAMDQVFMDMLYGDETLGYNSCDYMPAAVCLEFQDFMAAFVEGTADPDAMLPQIDAAWVTK